MDLYFSCFFFSFLESSVTRHTDTYVVTTATHADRLMMSGLKKNIKKSDYLQITVQTLVLSDLRGTLIYHQLQVVIRTNMLVLNQTPTNYFFS